MLAAVGRGARRRATTRRYPHAALFAHPVGYSYIDARARAGLERYYNDELTRPARRVLRSLLDAAARQAREGDDLTRRSIPAAQRVALDGSAAARARSSRSTRGPARVQVMASVPGYDPNALRDRKLRRALNRAQRAAAQPRHAGGYPPGSTFKVVTATAAIDSGKYTPDSTVDGKIADDDPRRAAAQLRRRAFGDDHADEALTNSVNTVCGAGRREARHAARSQTYMDRFGFDRKPPLDYPPAQMVVRAASTATAGSSPRPAARRHRPHGDRPGQAARSRRCRWRWSRRRSPTAAC